MSRKLTGTVWRSPDGSELKVRVTITDDKGQTYRPWISLNPKFDDEKARKIALRAAEAERGKPRPRKTKGIVVSGTPTCDEYFEKLWMPARDTKKRKAPHMYRSRWRLHIKPIIGDKLMGEVTADDLRDLVQALDEKVADPELKFGPTLAKACWSLVSKMFKDACSSKLKELRVIKENPAFNVSPPDPPEEPEKQWLFPVELHQLLACKRVPLVRRRLYATAVYCCARAGEALALLWGKGVDLQHNMVRINRTWDSEELRFQEFTKEGDSRHFAIELILRPVLQVMANEATNDLVFPTLDHLADTLRADLLRAGVTRAALHERKPGALLMRFHDLRATGVTYMALRGDPDNAIRERAGHKDFKTTQLYIRRGHQAHGASIGEPFAPLPEALLGIGSESSCDPAEDNSEANPLLVREDPSSISVASTGQNSRGISIGFSGPIGAPGTTATVTDDSGTIQAEGLDAEELEFLAAILEDGERALVARALTENAAWRSGGSRP